MMSKRVLLLAGTQEARLLAGRMLDMPEIELIASLAGVTREPQSLAAETRVGGFGGTEGLIGYLRDNQIRAIVDATHPFSDRMPWQALDAAQATALPRLRLLRPKWPIPKKAQQVHTILEAATMLPSGARAFVTTGRQELAPFIARTDCWFLMRSIEPPDALPKHIKRLAGLPGKDYSAEFAILCSHRITHLISKNSGGAARAKLDAAMGLGLPIILIDRPLQPPGDTVETTQDAVAWLHQQVGFGSP